MVAGGCNCKDNGLIQRRS